MPKGTRISGLLVVSVVLALLSACSEIIRNHGYVPPEEDLAEIVVGRDTRDSVAQSIGRPGIAGILDDGGWYYVRYQQRTYAWQAPREVSREVVAISFSPSGVVTNIETFGLERGRIVTLNRRVTDSNIADVGFLRQAFGNLGRVDPGSMSRN